MSERITADIIHNPEFINLSPLDINPLMSECDIKVLYLGGNRNGTFIDKEVAMKMSKTLRGSPIVGYWREDAQDFGDHGERVTIDVDGVKFECLTMPYGFVSPDAPVWFQEFDETNGFGEVITREYLMTKGYLWTEQFPECKVVLEGEGKPQSMEITDVSGAWERNAKGLEFFIINDATFSKLCILGSDVEPCFEGARVQSASFAKIDTEFKDKIASMMQELKYALEGGNQVSEENQVIETPVADEITAEVTVEETQAPEAPVAEEVPVVEEPETPVTEEEVPTVEEVSAEVPVVEEEPVAEEPVASEPTVSESEYNLVVTQLAESTQALEALQGSYAALEEEVKTLRAFKLEKDNLEKDSLIEKFSMLTEEEKKDIVEAKENYTLAEIEEKLSVLCFRKGGFNLTEIENNNTSMTEQKTYSFGADLSSKAVDAELPSWLAKVEEYKNK